MSPLLQAGLNVTAIGMGVVFILLTLLVGVIRGMSALSRVFEGREGAAMADVTPVGGGAADAQLVGVIGAAVAAYRRRRRSNADDRSRSSNR